MNRGARREKAATLPCAVCSAAARHCSEQLRRRIGAVDQADRPAVGGFVLGVWVDSQLVIEHIRQVGSGTPVIVLLRVGLGPVGQIAVGRTSNQNQARGMSSIGKLTSWSPINPWACQ